MGIPQDNGRGGRITAGLKRRGQSQLQKLKKERKVVARTAKFPRMYFNNFQDSDTGGPQVSFIFKGTLKMNERLVF